MQNTNAVAALDNDRISVNTVQSATPKGKVHTAVTCSPETSYTTEHSVGKELNTDMISEYNLVVNLPPLTENHKKVVSFHTDMDKNDTHGKGESAAKNSANNPNKESVSVSHSDKHFKTNTTDPKLSESNMVATRRHEDTYTDNATTVSEVVNTKHGRQRLGSTDTREESTKFPSRVFTSRSLDVPNQPSNNLNNTKKHRRKPMPLLR